MTDFQQKVIDNLELNALRKLRDELNEQLESVRNEFTYLANYRHKHPPEQNDTEQEYVSRMKSVDVNNPEVFFRNVFKLHIEAKNRR